MHRLARGLVALGLLLGQAAAGLAAECAADAELPKLAIGVPPWLGGAASGVWVRELGEHLRSDACIAASFSSDADFRAYVRSALAGKYDALIAPSHMGLFMASEHGFGIAAFEQAGATGFVLFVRADSPITTIEHLTGESIALPDPLALASLLVEHRLESRRIRAHLAHFPRHENVVEAVASGRAMAGGAFSPVLTGSHDGQSRWRVLLPLLPPGTPSGMMLVRPGLGPALTDRLQRSLFGFDTHASAFLPTFAPISDADAEAMERELRPFARMFAERLLAPVPEAPAAQR